QRQWLLIKTYQRVLNEELAALIEHVAEKGPLPWQLQSIQGEPDSARERFASELKARASVMSALGRDTLDFLIEGGQLRLRLADTHGKLGEALWNFVETYAMPASSGWPPQGRANAWVSFSAEPYTLSEHASGLPMRDVHMVIGQPGGRSS